MTCHLYLMHIILSPHSLKKYMRGTRFFILFDYDCDHDYDFYAILPLSPSVPMPP